MFRLFYGSKSSNLSYPLYSIDDLLLFSLGTTLMFLFYSCLAVIVTVEGWSGRDRLRSSDPKTILLFSFLLSFFRRGGFICLTDGVIIESYSYCFLNDVSAV